MSVWDRFWTAYNLAERVEEIESNLSELQSDWTDVQDKLLAREERLRKRMSRELKSVLQDPPADSEIGRSSPQGSDPFGPQNGSQAAEKKAIVLRYQQFRKSAGGKD